MTSRKNEVKLLTLRCQNTSKSEAKLCHVSLKPLFVKAPPGGQPFKIRNQLIVSLAPPPIKDVMEEAAMPRCENETDAHDALAETCILHLWHWRMISWSVSEVTWTTCHSKVTEFERGHFQKSGAEAFRTW